MKNKKAINASDDPNFGEPSYQSYLHYNIDTEKNKYNYNMISMLEEFDEEIHDLYVRFMGKYGKRQDYSQVLSQVRSEIDSALKKAVEKAIVDYNWD